MTGNTQERLAGIFIPHSVARMRAAREQSMRFVHYTSADTAARIISTRQIWMRNASTMNDFMEVQHGFDCLVSAYNGESGRRLKELLAPRFPRLFPELEKRFNGWSPHFMNQTFVLCVSEHLQREDHIGRLSMWRAYGGGTGVALVMKNTPFLNDSDALKAYTSPVAYLHREGFTAEFSRVVDNVAANLDFIVAQGEESVLGWLFHMMRYAIVSTKHEGFEEEREWRVVHSPGLDPSQRLACEIETIRGTPQRVYKIPLKNVPEENFLGAEIPEILDRIIIGPCQFAAATSDALVRLLREAGVHEPEHRVFVSNIPLRTT
jgi:hypothetical protein